MAIADIPNSLEVAFYGRDCPCCGPHDRFSDKGHNRTRTQFQNFIFQLIGYPLSVVKIALSFCFTTVCITGWDMVCVDQ